MPIARSGTANKAGAAATSLTFSHDNGSPSNGLTMVSAGNLQGANNLSNITYAAVNLTAINAVDQVINNWFRGLVGPAAGANDVVVSFDASQTIRASASSYSGVSQSGLPDSNATAFDNGSADRSKTITTTVVASNCWLVGGVINDSGAVSAGAGTSLLTTSATGENDFYDSNGTVGTGAQSLVIDWSVANDLNFNIASIAPPAVAYVPRIIIM